MNCVMQGLRSPTFLQAALLCSTLASTSAAVFPGVKWESQTPESVGFSSPRLEVLRAWLKVNQTTALHVSSGGRTLFEYGDMAKVSKVASVRKSILALLFGKYVTEGKVDLNKSVQELGLDDVQPFLPREKGATLLHLLTARSGIYHAAGNESLTSISPRRGSQDPGTYMQYQNWDFNAAGTAFEKLSGKNIFEALNSDLAGPIGMQDYDRALQRKNSSMPDSVHPEYAMYLSTRDIARIGLLMLRKGGWRGKQIIPKNWTTQITTLVTPQNEIHPLQLGNATGSGTTFASVRRYNHWPPKLSTSALPLSSASMRRTCCSTTAGLRSSLRSASRSSSSSGMLLHKKNDSLEASARSSSGYAVPGRASDGSRSMRNRKSGEINNRSSAAWIPAMKLPSLRPAL